MKKIIKKKLSFFIEPYLLFKQISKDGTFKESRDKTIFERTKTPSRTEIINYLLTKTESQNYLEIGVRDPDSNFNKIICKNKYSVDPGIEFADNPVDFKVMIN
jgi:hypothetical protein